MWHKTPDKSIQPSEQYRYEEWFRASFESTSIGKALVSLNGHWMDVNPALCRLVGYSREELLARSFEDITHPDDLKVDVNNVRQMLEGSLQSYQIEKRYIHKLGHVVYCLISVSMAYDEKKRPLYFISETQDVSERKRTEEALARSEKRFNSIMDHVVDTLLVHDREGRTLAVNQGACDSLGYTREELMQMRVPDFELCFEERKIQQLWDAMAQGEIRTFCVDGIHQRKDGSTFPVEVRVSLMETDGEPLMVAIARDVSERQRAQEALQKANDELERRVLERTTALTSANEQLQVELSERQRTEVALRDAQDMLRLVIDHIPDGIFWKDSKGVYLGCNKRLARDAGFASPAEIVGKTDYDMPWTDGAAELQKDDRDVMETGIPRIHIEEEHTSPEGAKTWMRTNKIPFLDSHGQRAGVLGSYEDITLQKETEAAIHQARDDAERASHAKDEFLSRTSHELRTPLNAILGFAQILEMGQLSDKQRESLSYISGAGEHLLELVNELLDLGRIAQGEQFLEVEPVSLLDTLGDVVSMTGLLAQKKNIHIEWERPRWVGLQVLGDAQRLKQVLLNLVSNAIKYNRDGGAIILSCETLADHSLCINVCDTGIGIEPEQMKQLFLPFDRLGAEKTPVEGTGLGLTIAKALMEAMHGRLEVESEPGVGSTFSVILPRCEVAGLKKKAGAAGRNSASSQGKTILYIEDNLSNMAVIQTLLEETGKTNLLSALQGSIGLELAEQHLPDLILLDIHLPDMTGDEVLRRLKASSVTSDIPVVMLSADATPAAIERLLAGGASAYLTKPLDVKKFLDTVDQMFENKAAAQS